MSKYRVVKNFGIINLETTQSIPFDPNNSDYQQYLKWLEEGNEPEISPEQVIEPPTAQQKLEAAGLTIEELKGLLGL